MTMPSTEPGGIREVKSAARTVQILEFLALKGNEPARIRELSETLGAPRSSVYALLLTLRKRGWVRTDDSGTLYWMGIRALYAGTSYIDGDPCVPVVSRHLDALREELDETFHFGRLDGPDVVYLATRESTQYLRPFSRVGRRLPAYSTSLGKAILSCLSDSDRKEHLPPKLSPLTKHTLVDRESLMIDLEIASERGYARDNEENTVGLRCFAVPLMYTNPVSDAISASIPVARLDEERERVIVRRVRRAAEEICSVLRMHALSR